MKTSRRIILAGMAAVILATASPVSAIEGLKLQIRCPDVVLSWPSTNDETYLVQYRATLDTNSNWQTLTNYMPPATGTNVTTFVHTNQVDCPVGQVFGMTLLSGGGNATLSASAPILTVEERQQLKQAREEARLTALYEKCKLEGREPYDWELKNQPPLPLSPEEVRARILKARAIKAATLSDATLAGPSGAGGVNGPQPADAGLTPSTGFYRVVRNGIHFVGLTNGMVLSGIVEVPIEMSLSSTDQITGISFYAGESPLIGAAEKNGGSPPWVMEWDTSMVTNGTYAIHAGVNFAGDDSATNSPVTVTVSNLVSFPNYFTRIFGSQMWIYAELAIPQADYEIAMYADETNYIGSFYGSTSDGVISFIWDLTDGGSYTFTNETFRGEFYITPAAASLPSGAGPAPADGPSPSQPAVNLWGKEYSWPGIGKFVVAYSAVDNNSTTTYKAQLMVSGGAGGEYGGVTQTLGSYGLGTYELSYGNEQGSAFLMGDGATKTNLLSFLSDIGFRNFYYFGHGSPCSIGGGTPLIPTITANELQRTLQNLVAGLRAANRHPYRLVFLDGCNTGSGTLCEQFGIPAQALSTNFFNAAGVRSRAFLGFKKTITFDPAQWTWRSIMLGGFFADWQGGNILQVCVSNAVNGVHSYGHQPMGSSWVIYGATNLSIASP